MVVYCLIIFRHQGMLVIEEAMVRTGQDMESGKESFIIFRKCYKSTWTYSI